MPTLKNLIDFVMANKTNKTFIGMNYNEIVRLIFTGINDGTLLYALDNDGNIVGMILAEQRVDKKVLFVTENLSMCLSTLKQFAKIAKERCPDYKLEWFKHGIHKQHDTNKIYKRMLQ
jgi:predicted molibdopterin-dependent oxidoreductase YjgC